MPLLTIQSRTPSLGTGTTPHYAQILITDRALADPDEMTEEIHAMLAEKMRPAGLTVGLRRSPCALSGRFTYDGHTRGHGTWKVQA